MLDKFRKLTREDIITLSQEELEAMVKDVPDSQKKGITVNWTPQMDAIVREYYPKKNKRELAAMLGVCSTTLRERYQELMNEDMVSD